MADTIVLSQANGQGGCTCCSSCPNGVNQITVLISLVVNDGTVDGSPPPPNGSYTLTGGGGSWHYGALYSGQSGITAVCNGGQWWVTATVLDGSGMGYWVWFMGNGSDPAGGVPNTMSDDPPYSGGTATISWT